MKNNRCFSDAPHRTAVSMALLKLSESGKLMELKDKWWSVTEEKMCPVIFILDSLNILYTRTGSLACLRCLKTTLLSWT